MARIITVTSGKGGAGKTGISLNLALELAAQRYNVCIFDADLGLANINILTGLYPRESLEAVVEGRLALSDIIIRDYQGVDIIPGSSGVEKIADLTADEATALASSFSEVDSYDFVIFDTSAGISQQVLSFCMASNEILLVVTVEPTSLTDAYALLKVLSLNGFRGEADVVVNQVKNTRSAQNAYNRLKGTVEKYLPLKIRPLGIVASDRHVPMAVANQTPFTVLFPECRAARCIRILARKLADKKGRAEAGSFTSFWDSCLTFMAGPVTLNHKAPLKSKRNRMQEKKDISDQYEDNRDEDNRDGDIRDALERIEKGVLALSADLQIVKNLIDKSDAVREKTEIKRRSELVRKADAVSLDFEGWLKKYKASGKRFA